MKRAFALGLALMMALAMGAMPAMGDGVDLAGMTVEELVGLRNEIEGEIAERVGVGGSVIYSGDYVVGIDIIPGRYTITTTAAYNVNNLAYINLYQNKEMFDAYRNMSSINLGIGQSKAFELEDGMILSISYGDGILTPSTKPSWAP